MSACPLCNTPLRDARIVATHARFGRESRRVSCATCGLVQVDPQPSQWELEAYYRSHEYRRDHGNVVLCGPGGVTHPSDPHYPQVFASMGYHRRTVGIQLSGKTEGAVLDVGCGPGHVLDGYRELGWDCYGLEPDEDEARKAVAKGHTIATATLEQYEPPVPFDLIVAHHVLEHLFDPVDALRRMRAMLAPGGRVVIEVPDVMRPSGPLSANWFQWVHLYDFSRWTLGMAFRQAGFSYTYDAETRPALWATGEAAEPGDAPLGPSGEWMAGYLGGYRVFGGGD